MNIIKLVKVVFPFVAISAVSVRCAERYNNPSMQVSGSNVVQPGGDDNIVDIGFDGDMGRRFEIEEVDVSEIALPELYEDPYNEIITGKIIDQNLLRMIRKGLNKSVLDDVTLGDALGMTNLIADSSLIYYLDGIEYFQNLSVLGLNYNKISDITPLAGLKSLIYLNLYGNKVSDLSLISGMPLLNQLSLGYNAFTDVSPLLDNPGIGEGDIVCLDGNNVPAEQIEALKLKGATVTCAW